MELIEITEQMRKDFNFGLENRYELSTPFPLAHAGYKNGYAIFVAYWLCEETKSFLQLYALRKKDDKERFIQDYIKRISKQGNDVDKEHIKIIKKYENIKLHP